jgi:hypothetical protein
MPLVFRTVSGITLLAIIALLALQAVPQTGVFLMIFGGAVLTGVLVHVFLISLFAEACFGRIPRALATIPLTAYAGYYALYADQTVKIWRESAELRKQNSGKVFDFDPELHSLVTPDAQALVTQYAVPVIYASNKNFSAEGHVSYRLLTPDQCRDLPGDSQHRIQTSGFFIGNVMPHICLLTFPESPRKKTVTAVKYGDEEIWKRKRDIGEQLTEIVVDGAVIGRFKTASVWRLPVFPMAVVGCGLISSTPAWKCSADFMRSYVPIDTVPDGIDRTKYRAPESVMLGILRYTEQDYGEFKGFRQNDEALVRLADEPRRVEEENFTILKELVDGGNPKMPFLLGHSVAKNPARLEPFAEAMARRLIELLETKTGGQNWLDQMEALRTALAALPRDKSTKVSDILCSDSHQKLGANFTSRLCS